MFDRKDLFLRFSLLSLLTSISSAQADDAVFKINVNDHPYLVKRLSEKVVVIPQNLKFQLSRNPAFRIPDCAEFENTMRDLQKQGAFKSCDNTSGKISQSRCDASKDLVELAVEGELPPTGVQEWRITANKDENSIQDKDQEELDVIDSVAKELNIDSAQIVVDFSPSTNPQFSQATLLAGPTSWSLPISKMGVGSLDVHTSNGTFNTQGINVACDLLNRRAQIGWAGTEEAHLSLKYRASSGLTWSVYEQLQSEGKLPGISLLEKAAVLGSRLNSKIKAYKKQNALASDQLVLDLFDMLYMSDSLTLKSFRSYDDLKSEFFQDPVNFDQTFTAGVNQ